MRPGAERVRKGNAPTGLPADRRPQGGDHGPAPRPGEPPPALPVHTEGAEVLPLRGAAAATPERSRRRAQRPGVGLGPDCVRAALRAGASRRPARRSDSAVPGGSRGARRDGRSRPPGEVDRRDPGSRRPGVLELGAPLVGRPRADVRLPRSVRPRGGTGRAGVGAFLAVHLAGHVRHAPPSPVPALPAGPGARRALPRPDRRASVDPGRDLHVPRRGDRRRGFGAGGQRVRLHRADPGHAGAAGRGARGCPAGTARAARGLAAYQSSAHSTAAALHEAVREHRRRSPDPVPRFRIVGCQHELRARPVRDREVGLRRLGRRDRRAARPRVHRGNLPNDGPTGAAAHRTVDQPSGSTARAASHSHQRRSLSATAAAPSSP